MDFFSLLSTAVEDVSPGRLIETILALVVIWTRVKPFLKSYDERLKNLEQAVKDGFKQGELRFQKIEDAAKDTADRVSRVENRVSILEQKLAR